MNDARGGLQVNGVDKERWISAWEKLAGIVPLAIAFLGMAAVVGGIRLAFDYPSDERPLEVRIPCSESARTI